METREKQAYLIEAHKCDEMLLTLLRMLDVPWNDIFIHMDSKNTDYQPETVECRMKYAKVFHAKRHSVVWGGVSQVKAELVLLKSNRQISRRIKKHLWLSNRSWARDVHSFGILHSWGALAGKSCSAQASSIWLIAGAFRRTQSK